MLKFFSIVVLLIVLLDQSTKYLTQSLMYEGQSIPIIKNFFHLTYVLNPGAAFGMLAHKTLFFILVTMLVIVIAIYFYRRIPKAKWLLRLGLSLQVGGAIGNLIDRIRIGMVVDFFDFRIWPVFNIADMAIVIGVGILFVEILRYGEKEVA